ncbi:MULTISPECIES: YceI family protein [unclassified Leisingera]|uniref:YceI family protein n=1 Tax=unclassified Leisingera TaxID=2614906 RepID=UPI001ED985F3|nr:MULTISPECIES: YceI family protein [unclassified Leisingera]
MDTYGMKRRKLLACLSAAMLAPQGLGAAPLAYQLVPEATDVRFTFLLSGQPQHGRIPVAAARILIDPADLARSQADITLDARRASTGLIFATEALKGPGILDTARHPHIRFRSTRVRLGPEGRLSGGSVIKGDLTLRGTTRPITLQAALYRRPGSAPDDLRELDVRLSGQLSRAAFGATGYADLVADRVRLAIKARIRRAG